MVFLYAGSSRANRCAPPRARISHDRLPNFQPPLFSLNPQQTLWDDATWAVVNDYVSGQATEAAVTAVHTRMAVDPAYAMLVVSVQEIWALPWEQYLADEEPLLEESERVESPTVGRTIRRLTHRMGRRWQPVLWSTLALAASILLGLQLHWRALHPRLYYHAGATAQVVTLPDHSTVWLAPGAYLGTSRSFIDGARTVYLFGQARFAVAHNPARPFVVHVLELQATALGTTSTVASDTTARVTVNVHEGKVELDFMGVDGKLPGGSRSLLARRCGMLWRSRAGLRRLATSSARREFL